MRDALRLRPAVLVISGDSGRQQQFQSGLRQHGFEAVQALSGQAGIEQWSAEMQRFRILLTDLRVPGVDGWEIIRTVRDQEVYPTCILVVDDGTDEAGVQRALEFGADDTICWPHQELTFARRISCVRKFGRLHDQSLLLGSLAVMTAQRSGETATHLERVQSYCRIIALDLKANHPELGLTLDLAEDIAGISILHDIGNSGIPDGLLHKRRRCTDKEFEIIKDHTTIGGNLLLSLYRQTGSAYLLLGYEMALFHHERWDGGGYPKGLKGEVIPLAARIIAFADVFDALLSKRPYKDPLSLSHAEIYIQAEKGKHFDPRLVAAYERNRDSFIRTHNTIQDKQSGW